jgi:hypothetical protein
MALILGRCSTEIRQYRSLLLTRRAAAAYGTSRTNEPSRRMVAIGQHRTNRRRGVTQHVLYYPLWVTMITKRVGVNPGIAP